MASKSAEELRKHMLGTYYSLRIGLMVVGFALPLVVLFAGGFLHDVWFEGSISRYYYTKPKLGYFVARDLFVGGLFAAAACLWSYKGFADRENWVLNSAAAFAVLVALMPTSPADTARDWVAYVHGTCAVLFFLCIAFVSLFHARDTIEQVPPSRRSFFMKAYAITGAAMLLFPLAAVGLSFALEAALKKRVVVFVVETLGVWAFCAYWGIKTYEMRVSAVDGKALDGELERAVVTVSPSDGGSVASAGETTKSVERIVPAGTGDTRPAA